jgi:hypothetical protein
MNDASEPEERAPRAERPDRPELPPAVAMARADVADDPDAAEARGVALMDASANAIVSGVDANAMRYVFARSAAVLDAWMAAGRAITTDRDNATDQLREAAKAAQQHVVAELRSLLELDPASQARTPLEIVRDLRREPTEVLTAIGVGAITRDPFEERALPDDPYGLAPRTLSDLGDDDLGPLQLAWGLGKATVLRARAAQTTASDGPVDNLSISGSGAESGRSSLGTMPRMIQRVRDAMRSRAQREKRGNGE